MSLFFATTLLPAGPLLAELKLGALLSLLGLPLAFVAARLLHVGRFVRHAYVHPRPATLARAREQVEVRAREHAAVGVDEVVVAHVGMPGIDVLALAQVEQALHQFLVLALNLLHRVEGGMAGQIIDATLELIEGTNVNRLIRESDTIRPTR